MKNKYEQRKELEKLATELTGIDPVIDYEYQKIHYIPHTQKVGGTRKVQSRYNLMKLKHKRL